MLVRDATRPLRQFSRDQGVLVRNKRAYPIAKSLYNYTRSQKNVWIDDGHSTEDDSTEPNNNTTKDPSNSQESKMDPMYFNMAKYNQTQRHPEANCSYNHIANLTRIYNDEIKISGEISDNFDDRFDYFMDYRTRLGISHRNLHDASSCLLKGIVLTLYYNECRGKLIKYLQSLIKLNFEGPEYQRYTLKPWNESTKILSTPMMIKI